MAGQFSSMESDFNPDSPSIRARLAVAGVEGAGATWAWLLFETSKGVS